MANNRTEYSHLMNTITTGTVRDLKYRLTENNHRMNAIKTLVQGIKLFMFPSSWNLMKEKHLNGFANAALRSVAISEKIKFRKGFAQLKEIIVKFI